MRSLFVDTWAWFAINVIEDRDHTRANRTNRELIEHRYNYVTSNFVLDEAYSLIRRKAGFQRAISFGYEIRRVADLNILTIITITPEIEREAWRLFEMYETVSGLSYTDCTSFAAMQARGLRQAFTNDEHFALASFERVPAAD